ncbi:MAG: amidase [Clostridia bacterium]|nr:amidase [Clostridia bacterium]
MRTKQKIRRPLLAVAICLLLCLLIAWVMTAPWRTGPEQTGPGTTTSDGTSVPEPDLPREVSKEAVLAALYEADISTLQAAMEGGLVTSEELTAYYLERIEACNEPYNCFITLCDDALETARARDADRADGTAKGALWGIPVVVKDNIHVLGYKTTNGYKLSASKVSATDAAVVKALKEAGAVIIGKANMSTAAQSARTSISLAVGETKNAYCTWLAAGGSSGGSAVAVSLNFAAASLGTDTNSSLRVPAVLNGCVSLRCTYGKISTEGVIRLNKSRDIPGAITRTVYDQALMLDVLTGNKYEYAKNLDANALQGVRLGVIKELTYNRSGTDAEVAAAFERAIEELKACGAEVVEVSIPNILSLSQASLGGNAEAPKTAVYNAYKKAAEKYDVDAMIFPTYLSAPIYSGTDDNGKKWDAQAQSFINNCYALGPSAKMPEMSVLIGTHSRGAGIGMEIAALRDSEQLLLNLAYSYTQKYDYRTLPDGAPNHYADCFEDDIAALLAEGAIRETIAPEVPESSVPAEPESSEPAGTGTTVSSGTETSPETSVPADAPQDPVTSAEPVPDEPKAGAGSTIWYSITVAVVVAISAALLFL